MIATLEYRIIVPSRLLIFGFFSNPPPPPHVYSNPPPPFINFRESQKWNWKFSQRLLSFTPKRVKVGCFHIIFFSQAGVRKEDIALQSEHKFLFSNVFENRTIFHPPPPPPPFIPTPLLLIFKKNSNPPFIPMPPIIRYSRVQKNIQKHDRNFIISRKQTKKLTTFGL